MRYMVSWRQSATDELARFWMEAPDPQAVTAAANRLEILLRDDPEQLAIPFYGDWLLIELPLAVVFELHPQDCRVIVNFVWHQ